MRSHIVATCVAILLCVCVLPAAAQINGGFESGTLANWIDNSGGNAFVVGSPANGFPTEGAFFLTLNAGDSNNITPSHGPHIPGGSGVAQVSRTFTRPAGSNFELLIDWSFHNFESVAAGTYNDFLSIDVIDVASGALVQNVVFVDTGTLAGLPFYTNAPGSGAGVLSQVDVGPFFECLPTGMKRAYADLSTSTTVGQNLRLDISVGNDGDSAVDSTAVIDNLVIRGGDNNLSAASLRLLSSPHDDVEGATSNFVERGPFQMRAARGQSLAFRMSSTTNGQPLALVAGQESRLGTDFGFGQFNLQIPTLSLIFDGINPTTAADALLGTLPEGNAYISAQVPESASNGQIAFQGITTDASNAFGLALTAATNLTIDTTTRIPEATTNYPLADDGFTGVSLTSLSGGAFTFFGVAYSQVFVGANGFLTFGSGSGTFTEGENDFRTGQPRIAGLWDDFNPSGIPNAVRADVTFDVARFTWKVREFGSNLDANHFTIELFANGVIQISYDALNALDGLVGISPGNLAAAASPAAGLNLSSGAFDIGSRFVGAANTPIFQQFNASLGGNLTSRTNDLMTLLGAGRITFVPNVGGGYDVFSGTR